MINILNEQHPNMQFAMVNDTIKILNDHDDGGVAATMIFGDANNSSVYKDANFEVQLTLDELFEVFVKGALVFDDSGKIMVPEYIDLSKGCIRCGSDYFYAEGYQMSNN